MSSRQAPTAVARLVSNLPSNPGIADCGAPFSLQLAS